MIQDCFDIEIHYLRVRSRKHVIQIYNCQVLYFYQIQAFGHKFMLCFERGERRKIVLIMYFKHNSYIFAFVLLVRFFITEQMRDERIEIVDIIRIDFVYS